MKVKRMVGGLSAGVIVVLAMTSMTVFAETAKLRVSIEGGAFNSKFKFFDASEGCPGYNDIPGAKAYLGSIFASDKALIRISLWVSRCRYSFSGRRRRSVFRPLGARKKFADARCRWC